MSTPYGPLAVTIGVDTRVPVANLNVSCAIVANESPYTLKCVIDGSGSARWIHALTIDKVDIPANGAGFTGNLIFIPTVVLDNTSNAPSYALLVDTYGPHEQPTGTYPIALNRAVIVTNPVNTVMGGANIVQNDGNPSGTIFIEATPSGEPASAVQATVDGKLTLGNTTSFTGQATVHGTMYSSGVATFDGGATVNSGLMVNSGATVNGGLTVGGGGIQLDNARAIQAKDNTGIARQIISTTNTNKVLVYSIGDLIQICDINGNVIFELNPSTGQFHIVPSTGNISFSGAANIGQGGGTSNVISGNGTNTHINAAIGTINFDINGINQALLSTSGLAFAGAANIGHDGVNANALSANSVNTHIVTGSGSCYFDFNAGGGLSSIDQSGHIHTPQVLLSTGGISRLSTFTGTGSSTVSHGLGATPTFVSLVATGSNSASFGYSANSTSCTVTCGASVPWIGLAIGF